MSALSLWGKKRVEMCKQIGHWECFCEHFHSEWGKDTGIHNA